jgi:5-methyltetrahydrofolate--homocysteine methyltransferase
MTKLDKIKEALIKGDEDTVIHMVKELLEAGNSAKEILNDGLMAGMDIIGERMEKGEMFIPEVLKSANIMSAAVNILNPLLADEEISATGKVVIGTVKGDLHDIGKNLIIMMLESAGFEIFDLGIDVPPEKFVGAIMEKNPDILALSALLTTTMPMIQKTIETVTDSGLRDPLKIMVGGAPVTQKFATDVGADGYAPDAGSASKLAKSLVQ